MTIKKLFTVTLLIIFLALTGSYFLFPDKLYELAKKVERSDGGLTQQHIEVDGLRMEYLEGGEGEVLLLLHGFGANKDNWTRIAKHLTPHFRVIAPDLVGFGESEADPENDYSINVQAQRIKAFVGVLGIKTFHLGGNSMGGNIAGAYASTYSQDLKSLWLIAPGGVISSEPSELDLRLGSKQANPLVASNVDDYEKLLDFVFVKRPFIPLPIKKVLIAEAIEHQPLNDIIFRQIRRVDAINALELRLKNSTVKTLIVWGEQDRVLHYSGAKIIGSVILNSKIEIMKAVGHAPMIEKPQETAELYLEFIN